MFKSILFQEIEWNTLVSEIIPRLSNWRQSGQSTISYQVFNAYFPIPCRPKMNCTLRWTICFHMQIPLRKSQLGSEDMDSLVWNLRYPTSGQVEPNKRAGLGLKGHITQNWWVGFVSQTEEGNSRSKPTHCTWNQGSSSYLERRCLVASSTQCRFTLKTV